jgi:HD-GYP domain
LRETQLAIDSNVAIDVPQINGLVGEMAAGVQRNPDALLWLSRLKRTDQYAYDHAVNVSVHAMVFARFVGLSGAEVRQLGTAGLLQDIGKVQIDYEVLSKPGPLNETEFEHVKAHVRNTVNLLRAHKDFDASTLAIIAAHHERFDGTGYPRGLEGMSIPLAAEMAGIVDSYCAMTTASVCTAVPCPASARWKPSTSCATRSSATPWSTSSCSASGSTRSARWSSSTAARWAWSSSRTRCAACSPVCWCCSRPTRASSASRARSIC